jgi:hypothetical protein
MGRDSELVAQSERDARALGDAVGMVLAGPRGTDTMHGSGMSGRGQYAVLGMFAIVMGAVSLAWPIASGRTEHNQPHDVATAR